MIKDSGNRREFATGAVRDMQDGKGEEWRDCVSYEGLYQVSNLGRVRSLYPKTKIKDKNGIMRQKVDGKGYRRVNLTKNGTQKAKLVSRLVAEAFIENPNGLPQVGHMDDNKLNNNCLNLYWTDAYENNMHNGKHDRLMASHAEKIDIIAQKLAKPVEAIDEDNGKIVRFASARAAARAIGASSAKISLCCNAKRNKHLGLKWRFVENENENANIR